MNPTWAPSDVPAATRGEFLAARATAVRELERRIGSPLGLFLNVGLVFGPVFFLMAAGFTLSQPRVETFSVALSVVVTAAALATVPLTVRRALRTRRRMALLLAWEAAERQTRSLPPGQVRADLRMPFDARQDADFEDVARTADTRAQFRPSAMWLILRAIPAGMGLPIGFILIVEGFRDAPVAASVLLGAAGAYLSASCLVAISGMFRMAWRLRRIWQAQQDEIRAWRAERIGLVAAAEVDRAWRRQQWLIAAPFLVISLLALVARARASDPAAVAIAGAIVVLAGLVTVVVLLVRKLRRQTVPAAEHDLTSVPPG